MPAKQGSNPQTILSTKKTYFCPPAGSGLFSQKGLRSAGGPKLLKWGLPGRGSNLLKSGRPLTSTTPRWRTRWYAAAFWQCVCVWPEHATALTRTVVALSAARSAGVVVGGDAEGAQQLTSGLAVTRALADSVRTH